MKYQEKSTTKNLYRADRSSNRSHRILGPGLLESVYEEALCHELHQRGIIFSRQQPVYGVERIANGLTE